MPDSRPRRMQLSLARLLIGVAVIGLTFGLLRVADQEFVPAIAILGSAVLGWTMCRDEWYGVRLACAVSAWFCIVGEDHYFYGWLWGYLWYRHTPFTDLGLMSVVGIIGIAGGSVAMASRIKARRPTIIGLLLLGIGWLLLYWFLIRRSWMVEYSVPFLAIWSLCAFHELAAYLDSRERRAVE